MKYYSRHRGTSLRLAVALVCVVGLPAAAQRPAADVLADSVRIAIEAAVDKGEVKDIEAALAIVDRAVAAFPDSPLLLHYRGYALYRAGSIALGRDGSGRARPFFDRAQSVLEALAKRDTIPETYALLASVYGMQIAVSRFPMVAGMRLGPKSSEWLDRAVSAGPRNPRVWLLKGIGDLHTPHMFGGGADKAERDIKQALALFADDHPAPSMPAWGLADAHVWLGQAYAEQKKLDAARAEYQAALALQPHNGWIELVLLPALDKAR